MPAGTVFLTDDLAKLVERSAAWVRKETARQRLRPSMKTPKGVNVFSTEDVGRYLAEREARKRARPAR